MTQKTAVSGLKDKVALVTGASRGIGRAISELLAAHGAIVAGTATSDTGAERINAWFGENASRGCGLKLDVTDVEGVEEAIAKLNALYGAPTILVNNAGATRDNLLLRMKAEDWDHIVDINLNSAYRLSKACLRGMIKARYGRIINISSVVASMGNPGQANYAAAKAGLAGFAKSLAREVGSRGITVNTVAPGFIDTDMTRDLPEAQRSLLFDQIPLQRLGAPGDIAGAVLFLASSAAAYITGETLHINGGMYMT